VRFLSWVIQAGPETPEADAFEDLASLLRAIGDIAANGGTIGGKQ
jgi:hypothetical protein